MANQVIIVCLSSLQMHVSHTLGVHRAWCLYTSAMASRMHPTPGCGPAGCLQRPCSDDPCCGPAAWPDASGPPPAPRTGGQSRGRLGQLWQGWDNTGTILGQCWDITGTVLGQYWDSTGMSSLSPQINPKEIECDDFWTRFAGPVSTSP